MSDCRRGRVVDAAGATVFASAVLPVGFVARLRGLLGRPPLQPHEAWWFVRCNAVHTIGMSCAIDVVHLDGECRILGIRQGLAPRRWSVWRGSRHVLELGSGTAMTAGLEPGQVLRFAI